MKPLYIIGAGGGAKEIFLLIKEINEVVPVYDFKGFVDIAIKDFLQIGEHRYDIINESEFLNNKSQEVAIVFGLADTERLKKIVELYKENKNFEFPNLVHPLVKLDNSVLIGEGNIISIGCVLTVDIKLGSFNYINRGVHIGHDCVVGSYNVINPCAVISGGVVIEDENLIGTHATVLQYLKIGSINKIGAGAVITKNVENDSCMIGIPAKNNLLNK
ncbi:sugar O-acyltransferase, sialic acid O-acetyltransferase NeuD family [Algibacter lectus]|uniref:acetyltransferase n=1 Tax=Algibacter lectus TaxID=221126 RepID=UPI0008F0C66F|nr:acetyltransferase [Algibacter lectus]SFC64497.1 sugar O-acyltransferase, sialic acid O-acetyltransferase NeuD family [Algibacter lectus]